MTLQIIVDALRHDAFHVFKENVGLRLCKQIFNDFNVSAGLGFELGFTARVGQSAAVEDETATVATEIVGIAFAE